MVRPHWTNHRAAMCRAGIRPDMQCGRCGVSPPVWHVALDDAASPVWQLCDDCYAIAIIVGEVVPRPGAAHG